MPLTCSCKCRRQLGATDCRAAVSRPDKVHSQGSTHTSQTPTHRGWHLSSTVRELWAVATLVVHPFLAKKKKLQLIMNDWNAKCQFIKPAWLCVTHLFFCKQVFNSTCLRIQERGWTAKLNITRVCDARLDVGISECINDKCQKELSPKLRGGSNWLLFCLLECWGSFSKYCLVNPTSWLETSKWSLWKISWTQLDVWPCNSITKCDFPVAG